MSEFGLAIWLHSVTGFRDAADVERHADRLAQNKVDIFIPCVKNPPGAVDFFTELADVNPQYPDWDPLKVLIERCQERGVKVHPWFCVFPEGESSRLLREHPDYRARFESRMPWACQGGQCTCAYCREQMQAEGVDIEAVEYRDPAWQRWCEWRVGRISRFVGRMRELTRRRGLELSAAVFANYPDCREQQGQDWLQWVEEGLVDFVFPMNYTNSLRMCLTRTVAHAALVNRRAPLWEGLRSSASQLTPADLERQARGALEAGATGIVLFSYPALTDEDFAVLRAIRG